MVAAFEPRGVLVDQHAGDAGRFAFAQQIVRIVQVAGQGHQIGDGREGDVALAEVEPDLDLVTVFEDLALGPDAGGIRAGGRLGEAEAGHVFAGGELGQVVVFLRLGAVVLDQFGRAQRIGDDDEGADRGVDRADLGQNRADGQGGERLAAVRLGNEEAHEAFTLEKAQHLVRYAPRAVDVVAIQHAQQLIDRAVEKGLFLVGELAVGAGENRLEVGVATKELPVDPYRAGLQGLPLGVGNARQDVV